MVSITEDQASVSVILAKKTLDILHVADLADTVLREKFNGDCSMWLEAIFHSLRTQNTIYLQEETPPYPKDDAAVGTDLFAQLNDRLLKVFEEYKYMNTDDVSDSKAFLNTSFSIIRAFNKFINMLLQYKMPLSVTKDLIYYLKQIEDDVGTYLSTCYKFDTTDTPAEGSVSQEGNFETANSNGGVYSSVSSQSAAEEVAGRSLQDNVVVCDQCNSEIVIFNNNVEFSMSLHSEELFHKNAVIRACYQDEDAEYDEMSIRLALEQKIKEHSSYIDIVSKSLFYCGLCKCNLGQMKGVINHVKGRLHLKRHVHYAHRKENELQETWTGASLSKKRIPHNDENELNLIEYEQIQRSLKNLISEHINFMEIVSKQKVICHLCDCSISPIRDVEAHVMSATHQSNFKVNPSLCYFDTSLYYLRTNQNSQFL